MRPEHKSGLPNRSEKLAGLFLRQRQDFRLYQMRPDVWITGKFLSMSSALLSQALPAMTPGELRDRESFLLIRGGLLRRLEVVHRGYNLVEMVKFHPTRNGGWVDFVHPNHTDSGEAFELAVNGHDDDPIQRAERTDPVIVVMNCCGEFRKEIVRICQLAQNSRDVGVSCTEITVPMSLLKGWLARLYRPIGDF